MPAPIPKACVDHEYNFDSDCLPCYRYIRWAAPHIRAYVRPNKAIKPGYPLPCTRHREYERECNGCKQWAIVEHKASRKYKLKEARRQFYEATRKEQQAQLLREETERHEAHLALVHEQRVANENCQIAVAAGYVYVIENPAFTGWIKIGSALDPDERLSSYQTGDPSRSYAIRFRQFAPDRVALEKAVHQSLKCERKGEWFKTTLVEATNEIRRLLK